jgi:hypothetical protein
MHGAIITTNSYQMFLSKVGYRVVVVKQIHENDCYSPPRSPRAAFAPCCPFTHTATYSTMVTLVTLRFPQ